jgi:hypothetical protein
MLSVPSSPHPACAARFCQNAAGDPLQASSLIQSLTSSHNACEFTTIYIYVTLTHLQTPPARADVVAVAVVRDMHMYTDSPV